MRDEIVSSIDRLTTGRGGGPNAAFGTWFIKLLGERPQIPKSFPPAPPGYLNLERKREGPFKIYHYIFLKSPFYYFFL